VSVARLAHPEWLGALYASTALAGVLLAAAHFHAHRRRIRLLGRSPAPPRRHLASDAVLWVALVAIALALLGPRVGERTLEIPASGVDVVLLFDVSRSMEATDVAPSRLDRARRAGEGLLARLASFDRAALAAFAGRGVLLTPLTPDRDALVELLGGLDTELLAPRSSDLGEGVRAALGAFEAGSERPRVVVVLSDGEDPERHRDLGVAEALRSDARVLALAVGTAVGSTLPDHGVPLRDRFGGVVVSRRERSRLDALAEATDGAVFLSDRWGAFDLERVATRLRRDVGEAGDVVRRRIPAVRVLPFAVLALALLLVEGLPRPEWPTRRRAPLARRRAAVATGLAIALLLEGSGAPAQPETSQKMGTSPEIIQARLRLRPEDPALLIDLGLARLERGQREAAARAFLAAALHAGSAQAAAIGYYDLGVAHLERGDLEGARDAFFEALALAPDQRARYNLEWTLRALAAAPPPPEPPPPPRRAPPRPEPTQPAPASEKRQSAAAQATESPPPPPPPSEAQQRRWLERVVDDPARALRAIAAASQEDAPRERAGVPAW
jgi:Ca-activated chloride channel family protein